MTAVRLHSHPRIFATEVRCFSALLLALLLFGDASVCNAAEVIPPKPDRYFSDYAGVVSKEKAGQLNEQLAQFERETSNQIVVAVFRKMQSEDDISAYTERIADAWKVGQAGRNNGAVLFVFIDDRKMFVQVGYGLEGAIPDVTAFDITERHIKPAFRKGDYEGGLTRGVELLMLAARGEYKGSGRTVAEGKTNKGGVTVALIILFLFLLIFFAFVRAVTRHARKHGRRSWHSGGPIIWSGSGGGWSSGGGGWSSGGGGFSSFSGGGGSFGGGGAGSSW